MGKTDTFLELLRLNYAVSMQYEYLGYDDYPYIPQNTIFIRFLSSILSLKN